MMRDILAIEVTAAALRCLRLRPTALGGRPAFTEHSLPPGLVVPAPDCLNVRDEADFVRALKAAVGSRPPRWARLVLPDRAMCLRVLRTASGVQSAANLRPFLMRDLQGILPFPVAEARLSYAPAPLGRPGNPMALALAGWERVIGQYERLLATAGIAVCHAAPAAWHLYHHADLAAHAGPGVAAFLALGHETATLFLTREGAPCFLRTFRPAVDPASVVLEVHDILAHAQAALGVAPPANLTVAGEASSASIRASLQQGLGLPCAPCTFTVRTWGSEQLPAGAQAVLAAALAGTPIGLPTLLPARPGVSRAPVCNPPGGVCPPECRGGCLQKVAAGFVLATVLAFAGPNIALAAGENAMETRGPQAQGVELAAATQLPLDQQHGASLAPQASEVQQGDAAAEAQESDVQPEDPPVGTQDSRFQNYEAPPVAEESPAQDERAPAEAADSQQRTVSKSTPQQWSPPWKSWR